MRRRHLVAMLTLAAATVALAGAAADAATGDLLKTWGEPGQRPGQLGFIYGLARDAKGTIWVADTSNGRLQRFSGGGRFQRVIAPNLLTPEGVAVGPDAKIYVTDSGRSKIKVYGRGGALVRKWGSEGSGRYRFRFPASVAVAPNGDVYVADRDNHLVKKYTAHGEWLATFQGLALDKPNGVALDPTGARVYIADTGHDRVVAVDTDGNLVGEWSTGDRPSMLAVSTTHVYVTNGGANQVQKFQTDGGFVTQWSGPDGMSSPCGVTLNPSGTRVWVAEFGNRRVQKFEA